MRYVRPHSIEDAVDLLAASDSTAVILAGGSDLLVRMKGGHIEPNLIVDIKAINGLDEIRKTAEGFVSVRRSLRADGRDRALKRDWPGVVEAANLIGSRQVQGRCTLAGNLCNASPAADSVPALIAARAKGWSSGREPGARSRWGRAIGAGKTSLAKDEIIEAILLDRPRRVRAMRICVSFHARRWISRWSAPA